ncbi:MAG: DNA primase, partial [Nitrospina sp.]|nr:DNA primase [Nitrospina sp.]
MSKEVKLTDATILDCLNANELGDGMLYAALHYGRFVYNYSSSEWLAWRGHYWALDEMNEALASVEKVVNCYGAALDTLSSEKDGISDDLRKCFVKRMRKLRSEHGRQNTLKFAQTNSQNALAVLGEQLDRDPWLLACSNGTVNLATGEMHPGRPDDFLTKASPVEWDDIEAPCPIWEKTLSEIFGGDMDLIHYVQRFFGYALTGLSNENVLPILWGQGRNGKTTIIETISKIMGPLAAPIQAEMLLDQGRSRSSAGPSPDIMSLKGLRLAF